MSHTQTADFEDKDGDRYTVDTIEGVIIIAYMPHDDAEPQSIALHAVDGGKIIDGIKSAMLTAALGGTYSAGEPLTDSGDDA